MFRPQALDDEEAPATSTPLRSDDHEAHGGQGDEDQLPYLCDWPKRCVTRCCPVIARWLDSSGFDQALLVRDITHFALYLSCGLSMLLVVMWAGDVFSFSCQLPHPWDPTGSPLHSGYVRCVIEAVGAVVFFGSLRDVIVMMGAYDSASRALLERKRQLMASLHGEVVTALLSAKENANALCAMIFQQCENKVETHVECFEANVIPNLESYLVTGSAYTEQRRIDSDYINRLTGLVEKNLREPGELAAALYHKVRDEFSKVFDSLGIKNDLNAFKHDGKVVRLFSSFHGGGSDSILSASSNGALPPNCSGDAEMTTAPSSAGACGAGGGSSANAGQRVFAPVKLMAAFVEELLSSDALKALDGKQVRRRSDIIAPSDRLLGCGRPPWLAAQSCGSPVWCCYPRFFGFVVSCLTCCCCKGCTQNAFEYPKYGRVGCLWFVIVSKLHERLIQSMVVSTVFCLFYLEQLGGFGGFRGCPASAEWAHCVYEMCRRSALLLALVCHIPPLLVCLVRIRDLDDVVHIMEDISKLEDIRGVVSDFDRSLKAEHERRALIDKIEERVFPRIELVDHFRLHVLTTLHHTSSPAEVLRRSTYVLVSGLELCDEKLGSAADWGNLPTETRAKRAQWLLDAVMKLRDSEFQECLDEDVAGAEEFVTGGSTDLPLPVSSGQRSIENPSSRPPRQDSRTERPMTPPLNPKKRG